jgi:putative RNA 2'-phosphotransferase
VSSNFFVKEGLKAQQRQYVHLSTEIETAFEVRRPYGKPTILTIKALLMYKQGLKFYLSKNGVWLTKNIQPCYFYSNTSKDKATT